VPSDTRQGQTKGTPDMAGSDDLTLIVHDGELASGAASVTITAY